MEAGTDPSINIGSDAEIINGGIQQKPDLSDSDLTTTEVVNISGKYNASIIAKNIVFDITEFNRLNPGFEGIMSLGGAYDLRLPSPKMDLFVANKYQILNECVELLLHAENTPVITTYTRKNFKKK